MPALPARRIDRARRQIDPPRKRAVPVYTRIMQSTHIHARMHGSARIFTTASALPSAIRADKATKAPQAPCSSELASMNANLEVGAYALANASGRNDDEDTPGFLPTTLSQAVGAAGSYTVEADCASGATQSRDANVSADSQSGINFNF